MLMNGTVYPNRVTNSEEEAFLDLFPFFCANSLAKNVSEKQHVFCLQTQNPIRTPARA